MQPLMKVDDLSLNPEDRDAEMRACLTGRGANVDAWHGTRFVVIGNPDSRRVTYFQNALERRGLRPAEVIAWSEVLTQESDWRSRVPEGAIVRIDSPGESADVERQLILRGAAVRNSASPSRFPEHGEILHHGLWFEGFRNVLEEISQKLPRVRFQNPPEQIAAMFDKFITQERLRSAEISVPRSLGIVSDYDHLRKLMTETGIRRVFLKLRSGSSASGIIALQAHRQHIVAVTSIEPIRHESELRLFNSLRVNRWTDERQIAAVIDALQPNGLIAEQWVPKAAMAGRTFDLRVLVIAGRAQHVVMRTSRGPLTNLHLGNERGDVNFLRTCVSPPVWDAAMRSCEYTVNCFPQSLSAGVDVALTAGFTKHVVFEVNAFGDLLPNVLHNGLDPCDAQLAAMI
ncbi:MAG: STM4014 family protein [Planctomycetaceae bacterium]